MQDRNRRSAWRQLADRTGLTYNPAGCLGLYGWETVHGSYRGRPLKLEPSGESMIQLLVEDTKLWVAVRNVRDVYFSLTPPLSAIVVKYRPPKGRVVLGDTAFDGAFLLRGHPVASVAEVFAREELRERLLRLRPGTGLVLSGQEIWLQRNGFEQDVEYLHFLFDLLCDLAERVEALA
jgi:hypothetical protein